jgi:hypothetical protein
MWEGGGGSFILIKLSDIFTNASFNVPFYKKLRTCEEEHLNLISKAKFS